MRRKKNISISLKRVGRRDLGGGKIYFAEEFPRNRRYWTFSVDVFVARTDRLCAIRWWPRKEGGGSSLQRKGKSREILGEKRQDVVEGGKSNYPEVKYSS